MTQILIVDDSRFSQRITSNLVDKFLDNVEFFFANDGQEGFDKYKTIKPDYVFVDLLMPKIKGQDLVKLIKEFDPDAKIVVISADVQMSVREEMEKEGILSFVNKPLNEQKTKQLCDLIKG